MLRKRGITSSLCVVTAVMLGVLVLLPISDASALTDKEQLGKLIFFDTNLSSPDGQSCGSCHVPEVGFVDPDSDLPVSEGIVALRVGNRNAPTTTYRGIVPDFITNDPITTFAGGMFWDGRAASLVEQAKAPFLNTLEMHNPNKKLVVHDLTKAEYAPLFKQVYGADIFNDVELAYDAMADAIATFEKSDELHKFNSKFDLFLAGEATLTDQEEQGRQLFFGNRANCSICHHTIEGAPPTQQKAAFTDSRYFNIGIPPNESNPFYSLIPALNPQGFDFVDFGLGAVLQRQNDAVDPDPWTQDQVNAMMGTVKVPTLRNIELTAPYGHNGFFKTLKDEVHFFNTRDVPEEGWPAPEVNQNIFDQIVIPGGIVIDFIGNQGLSDEEEDALVAFLKTLTDDYVPE